MKRETQIVPLPSNLFNTPSRASLLHKLVISHLASLRTGNAATKNRSEVNYSGKKIRPQKGTGKARLGSRGSPMLTGGGVSHGPRRKGPEGWTRKVNRREERLGLRVALSDKWRAGDLIVVKRIGIDGVSTRNLKSRIDSRGWSEALFIFASQRSADEIKDKLFFQLASQNLSGVMMVEDLKELGVWGVVKSRKVVIELGAVDELIARLDPETIYDEDDDQEWESEEGEKEMEEEEMAKELEAALIQAGVEQKGISI